MAVHDWSTTPASNSGVLTGITLDGAVMTVPLIDDSLRELCAQVAGQLGKVGYKGADMPSGATVNLANSTGWYCDCTGTTTITSLGTVDAGQVFILRFTSTLTLTHNASTLILPGGANITTAGGDTAVFVSLGAGAWCCINYTRGATPPSTGYELIASATAASVATVDFTGLSAFRTLRLTGKAAPATDGVEFYVRLSTDNGSSFLSSGYNNQQASTATTTTFVASFDSTGAFMLTGQDVVSNGANEFISFVVDILDFNQAAYVPFHARVTYSGNTNYINGWPTGYHAGSVARNALRFLFSSGNIASAYYVLEGIRG